MSSSQPTFKRRPKAAVTPDMNVTPLVDVVLVLLIIFMVLAPVVSAHYLGRLPPPDDKDDQLADANPDDKPLVLKIAADEQGEGVFKVGSIELDPADAPTRLGRLLAGRPDKVVYVDASDTTPYGLVLQGMSYAKDAEESVNVFVREKAVEQGANPNEIGRLRVTAVLVTKEIPAD